MKLIIEVDKKYYEACKDAVEEPYPSQIEEVIANGTPYNPSGVLTEAEKKICKIYLEDLDKMHTCNEYKLLMSLIDNAQAVDAYEQGYADGWKERFGEPDGRPRGTWLAKEETLASVSYYCSVCKTEGIPITPFCPWCGADMKGSANE